MAAAAGVARGRAGVRGSGGGEVVRLHGEGFHLSGRGRRRRTGESFYIRE
jgi:hypothetical protein